MGKGLVCWYNIFEPNGDALPLLLSTIVRTAFFLSLNYLSQLSQTFHFRCKITGCILFLYDKFVNQILNKVKHFISWQGHAVTYT